MKNQTLKKKLDKAIQLARPDGYCEVCGERAEVLHHFIQKSKSEALRYEPKNLIHLCNSCHYKHHTLGDPTIAIAIKDKRGAEWYKWILENRRKIVKQNKAYFEGLEKLLNDLSIDSYCN